MKKRNPTIVSVTATKVDPRESQARNMIMWLKTVPTTAIHTLDVIQKILKDDGHRAVSRLVQLAEKDFIVTVPGVTKDLLRVREADGDFFVGYLEHHPATEENEEHFCSVCVQAYSNVVDAFRCFQLRLESGQPAKSVRV